MRRSIVALAAGMLMLALAVPALAQDEPYPPVPAPTCALVAEVVTLPGVISLQGANWAPNSTVEIVILGLVYEVQTDEDGNFREDIVVSEEDLLVNLPDDIDLEELLDLTIECRGTDQEGQPRSVFLPIQVRIVLLEDVEPAPPAGEDGGGDNGLISGLLGTGDDAIIALPPLPLSTGLLSAEAKPVDWDPRTNGAAFVALLAMALLAVGGGDLLLWSRRRNDTTLPNGQNL